MKKNRTLANSITFIALMAAFNFIFALLMVYLPAFSLVLYVFLPFVTTITVLHVDKKYLSIYYISSILLTFIINLNGLDFIIFTLIPSLITGSVFGICLEKKVNSVTAILLSSFCQFAFSLLTIPLINAIYMNNQSIINVFRTFLGENREYLTYKLFLPTVFAVSLAQNIISFLIISSEINKFKVTINNSDELSIAYSYIACGLFLLTIISIFVFNDLMYLLLSLTLVLSLLLLFTNQLKYKKALISIGTITIILMVILLVIMIDANLTLYAPLLLLMPCLIIIIFSLFLSMKKRNIMLK